jgi:pimeloyl-[acyl-carrier protein] methyl ester esterase
MTTIYGEVIGQGPNLTLLHGWGLNGGVWDSVRAALAERYTLHIIDLPGHGFSKAAAISTLDTLADQIATVMPAHSHLLGWSLGGQIALAIARRHAARVNALVLIATTPCFLTRRDWPHAVTADVLADFGARLTTNTALTIKRFLALQVLNQPQLRDTLAALQTAVSARGIPSQTALTAALAILTSNDLRMQLTHIQHPTLVLQGSHDALTPEAAGRWLAAQLPRGQYALFKSAAHAPFLSHRDEFLATVNGFLPI